MSAIQQAAPLKHAIADEKSEYADRAWAIQNTLYAAAMAIVQNATDAEDVVQEAVLRGWIKRHSLKSPEYFNTWLTRILINTAINHRKKKRPTLIAAVPHGRSARGDERIDIRRAIAALDEKTRLATVLYYFEDMPIEQIAQVLSLRQGTVKSRLFRARAKLRDILEGYDDE